MTLGLLKLNSLLASTKQLDSHQTAHHFNPAKYYQHHISALYQRLPENKQAI